MVKKKYIFSWPSLNMIENLVQLSSMLNNGQEEIDFLLTVIKQACKRCA